MGGGKIIPECLKCGVRNSLKALRDGIENSARLLRLCQNYRPRRLSFSLSVANGAPGSLSEALEEGVGDRESV